ncbi:Bifunctional dethiobiotin synthetase/7,8-diamino-pelargonic acid aminotransferase, mitochondrial [Vitis vinifera]|uniref:Bifunctional dethiobiotin synthetase/7,8-diamino-pelargonic acid aminotransferase, mitochondrial n=1 Tax=Vitis vinifera TaxID=29760 RepID=A0A438D301_VITVI|nr:Bifunctional dethiobiotin synthetase/7,8-diamino-pelargonic acid aminotransferase, mitochondrial [Vitis vinifera]
MLRIHVELLIILIFCVFIQVIALKGSYHGDTLGAMEAQAPSSYTGFLQQPWYGYFVRKAFMRTDLPNLKQGGAPAKSLAVHNCIEFVLNSRAYSLIQKAFVAELRYTGKGLFLDPPTIFMCDGIWKLSLPEGVQSEKLKQEELIVHGSGGMHMIDPLFQRVLVNECRSRKIPVIFDEVFTGFWRLGAESASELLCCQPDIACFAKLMTGGIIPLAATLATDAVFNAFAGDSKLKALLHGHSYTAHAMGCTAAVKSIKWFKDPQTNSNITSEGRLLREVCESVLLRFYFLLFLDLCFAVKLMSLLKPRIQLLWDAELVHQISSQSSSTKSGCIGNTFCPRTPSRRQQCWVLSHYLLVFSLYGSLYARSLLLKLREDGVYLRPLGNVIYLMCGPCTSPETCSQLLIKLYRRLEEFKPS